ncbi:MAG: DUF411 domain-containing protein [Thauera sp.]|jgi:hypothetical protein|nr:DUF411 domain-containing protein [Thauera sp.]
MRIFSPPISRLLLGTITLLWLGANAHAADTELTMYKDPNCGCCGKWAEHMRENGFKVREVISQEMSLIKRQTGVPARLASCHTAKVGNYVIEGHVPASDVRRLLNEQPAVRGLAAPGMPLGSPGMEGPYPAEHYQVISFERNGRQAVFAAHN